MGDCDYDVVIIGCGSSLTSRSEVHLLGFLLRGITGIYGIAAARTYLEVHPFARLVILESEEVIGGTWSSGTFHLSPMSPLQVKS